VMRKHDVRRQTTALICHQHSRNPIPSGAKITVDKYMTSSYNNAMRSICVDCHKQWDLELVDKPNSGIYMTRCKSERPECICDDVAGKYLNLYFNRVVLSGNNSNKEGY